MNKSLLKIFGIRLHQLMYCSSNQIKILIRTSLEPLSLSKEMFSLRAIFLRCYLIREKERVSIQHRGIRGVGLPQD